MYVTEDDHERLTNLAGTTDTRGARLLAEEMERAVIVDEGEAPRPFVRLNSKVAFTDLTSGRTRVVEVVPPDAADIDRDRLSVLTPVGAALIGLPAGESIGVLTDDGRARVLIVVDVEQPQPAAA
ncbi:GreA/GreB family elongation factor [Phenylobacterium sp.]|uniref:GreA/GreB family elongation factor n=1 Tax=Phenylobacterium sp. TaxID=1871053 RepID=UPI0025F8E59D|nr:GreA/GreB family elongation factor [Phenylobacterium sp.]